MSCVRSGWLVPVEVLLVRTLEAVREKVDGVRTGEDFDAGAAEHVFGWERREMVMMMGAKQVVNTVYKSIDC